MVTDTHTALHLTAGGSTVATIISFAASWLPVLQVLAALIAIVSGGISLYFAIKGKINGDSSK